MKKNDRHDLRSKDSKELRKLLSQARTDLATAKLEQAMRKQTNVHTAQALRKKTAVIQTIIREKELNGS